MATSKDQARESIYDAVDQMAKKAVEMRGGTGAAMLRDAAIAWRAAVGGQQPGVVTVESK